MSENLMLGRQVAEEEIGKLDLVRFAKPLLNKPMRITFKTQELQALCPAVPGIQPDIYLAHISYESKTHFIESKSLKLWLTTFRERRIFCEELAVEIKQTLESHSPLIQNVEIFLEQNIRGGIIEQVRI